MARTGPERHAPEEVDGYLDGVSDQYRDSLTHARALIRECAPNATERVSYGIPIFRTSSDLVGLSASRNHWALHTMSPDLAKKLSAEFPDADVSGATVRFAPGRQPDPVLIAWLVRERIAELG